MLQYTRLHNNIGVIYFILRDFKNAEESFMNSFNKAEFINPILLQNIIDLYFSINNTNKAK